MKVKLNSIRTVVLLMAAVLAVALTAGLMVVTGIEVSGTLDATFEDYMLDMAAASGEIGETMWEKYDQNIPVEKYQEYFDKLKIEQLPSSYIYVVRSSDNMMVYHPTAEKIGQPVSNEVILNLCSSIQSGSTFEPQKYVEYVFKGAKKLAAYSVVADNNLIVVVTADKSDITNVIRSQMLKVIVFAVVLAGILLFLDGILITKILNPLSEVTRSVHELSQYRLHDDPAQTERLCRSNNEIGQIARAVRELRTNLTATIANLIESSDHLANASTQLVSNASNTQENMNGIDSACTDIANGATSQAQDTESASSQVIQMGELIDRSREAVTYLKETSGQAMESSASAGVKLHDVAESNRMVIKSTKEIRDSIRETNVSVEEIQKATELISEIASQTNLLSLNASIEAARAGEAGKGFAVVATEIQKLAYQASDSASRINEIIETLIDNSNKSVQEIRSATEIVEDQTNKLQDAIAEFEKVSEGLDSSLLRISEVERATLLLDTAKVGVMDVVQSLTAIAQENAASTEETAASITEAKSIIDEMTEKAHELSDTADKLEKDAGKWQIG